MKSSVVMADDIYGRLYGKRWSCEVVTQYIQSRRPQADDNRKPLKINGAIGQFNVFFFCMLFAKSLKMQINRTATY